MTPDGPVDLLVAGGTAVAALLRKQWLRRLTEVDAKLGVPSLADLRSTADIHLQEHARFLRDNGRVGDG
eukprot:184619-Alexandrium_andersonii.AAC.1